MRTTLVMLLCGWMSGCTFGVRGVDVDPGDPGPGPAGGMSMPQPIGPSTASPSDDGGVTPPPAPMPDLAPAANYGDPCDPKKMDCHAGLSCSSGGLTSGGPGPGGDSSSSLPGGYCTTRCESASCPAGTQCGTVGDRKLCLLDCPATGCRTGYICCTRRFTPGVCLTEDLCDR
jgi:hypothetical protein